MQTDIKGPLSGITVIDFTTLAPGPFATLILADAGADVVKVERPGIGDEMRIYQNAFGDNGVTFSILNAGKRSITADLKDPGRPRPNQSPGGAKRRGCRAVSPRRDESAGTRV